MVVGCLFNSADYLACKWIGDSCNHQPNGPRPFGHQAACDGAGTIARFVRNLPDLLSGSRIHQRAILQSTGNRGVRYMGEPCNVLDRRLTSASLRAVRVQNSRHISSIFVGHIQTYYIAWASRRMATGASADAFAIRSESAHLLALSSGPRIPKEGQPGGGHARRKDAAYSRPHDGRFSETERSGMKQWAASSKRSRSLSLPAALPIG